MAPTRQNIAPARHTFVEENLSAGGAYEISPASAAAKVGPSVSGSEVEIALAAQKIIEGESTPIRAVSVPRFELFARKDADSRMNATGRAPVRMAVEAGLAIGWDLVPWPGRRLPRVRGDDRLGRERALQGALRTLRDRCERRCASGAKRVKPRLTEIRAEV
jgi:hypothetical protein